MRNEDLVSPHPSVEKANALITRLPNIPWFCNVGMPSKWDQLVDRVSLDFLVNTEALDGSFTDPYVHWGTTLANAESQIERIIFDNQLMDEEQAITRQAKITGNAVEDFYAKLFVEYEGYYGDTTSY